MTDTLRVRLEELAQQAPAVRTPHEVAAERAWRSGRRWWFPARPVIAVTVAASLVLLVALAGVLAVSRRTPVQPARGDGALPSRIVVPPVGTPLVTEQPIDRAAYVIAANDLRRSTFSRGTAPVVVSADGGQYRVVPWHDDDHGLSLSPDGRRLAWVQGQALQVVTRTVVLTLATGQVDQVPDAPTAADGTAWSDDGTHLLVWGSRRVSPNEGEGAEVQVHDARSLRLLRRVDGSGPAAMVGGSVVVPQPESTTRMQAIQVDRAVVSPDGRRTAQVVMTGISGSSDPAPRLSVRDVTAAPSDVTPPVWLPPATYAEVIGWAADGVVLARYGGPQLHVAPVVQVVDPADGQVVRTLTALPRDAGPDMAVDLSPQVEAVAADVLASGRTSDALPRTWPWHSVERVRWWLADPLQVGLEAGLVALAVVLAIGLVVMARREA